VAGTPLRPTLVVIPTLMLDGSFSAPLAWMFAPCPDRVRGVYGFELTRELVEAHHRFVVELSWFIELHEFGLIVDFIRAHNPAAEILFGGMYAGIVYPEIFRRYRVDYFIRGDNELPLRLFVEGEAAERIPNLTGRRLENPLGYIFGERDFDGLDFDLSWFPGYHRHRNRRERFPLPHLVTFKGGCNSVHDGCDYCAGSKAGTLCRLFGRGPLTMPAGSLLTLLARVERRFQEVSLYLTRAGEYPFDGQRFDLDATIEIDSRSSPAQVAGLFRAFRKAYVLVSAYAEGLSGETACPQIYEAMMDLEDQDHVLRFYVMKKDARALGIPADHVMYSDLAFPRAAEWSFYTDVDRALAFSQRFYRTCPRHFVDGTPVLEPANPSYMWQCIAFSQGYPEREAR